MMKTIRRSLSLLLVAAMLLGLICVPVYADGEDVAIVLSLLDADGNVLGASSRLKAND